MIKIIFLVLINMLIFVEVEASNGNNKIIDYFNITNCKDSGGSSKLILIDLTTPLTNSQKLFIVDNFIKNLSWENKGDRIIIASLHNNPASAMDMVSICTPKPLHKLDELWDSVVSMRAQDKRFREVLAASFELLSNSTEAAQGTFLIEAITEIYRNGRYDFYSAKNRELILISDLYQNSRMLSFYEDCKNNFIWDTAMNNCPPNKGFSDPSSPLNTYLKIATPSLNKNDKVTIFHLNHLNINNNKIRAWWVEYFNKSGLNITKNLLIIPELQHL